MSELSNNVSAAEKPVLWVVIPCYNEAEVLPLTAPEFLAELNELISTQKISDKSRILFVRK